MQKWILGAVILIGVALAGVVVLSITVDDNGQAEIGRVTPVRVTPQS